MTTLTHTTRDSATMLRRNLKHMLRYPSLTLMLIGQPVVFLLLFVYVFGGTMGAGLPGGAGRADYLAYVAPAMLVITVASVALSVAILVAKDATEGIIDRFRTMPIARSSVLWAHVLTSLVANLASLVVVVLVALLMGFRSGAGVLAWLAVAGILTLFTLALTWLAVIPGLTASSVEGASGFSYPLIFLPFISSAFVPTGTMPGPVRAFAEHQPVTAIVDAIRRLLAEQPVGDDIWVALAWCVGLLVVAYAGAMSVYRRRVA